MSSTSSNSLKPLTLRQKLVKCLFAASMLWSQIQLLRS